MKPERSAELSRRLIDRRNGHREAVLAAFEDKRRLDYYQPALLEVLRAERTTAILEHARQTVPRFRELLANRSSITPENALSVLARLPPMTRAEIQADRRRFISETARDLREDATGGSTGTPMTFVVDAVTQQAREASLMWSDSLAGWRYGERIAMLWGSDRDVKSARQRLRSTLRWWIDNRRWYNAFEMGEAEMEAFHRSLHHFAPHLLVAYAGSAATFARFLQARRLVPDYPLEAVVTSAEVLLPGMRQDIEAVFPCPVFDRYGNREAGAIAAECSAHQGLHVNESDFFIEIDSPEPYRVPGPLLVTYYRNRAMPLIRYDTGDRALWLPQAPCGCGRLTRRLAAVVGRESDHIRTAHGQIIHGEYFTHVLYGTNAVKAFQFVQDTLQDYRLLLVANRDEVVDRETAWRAAMLEVLGPGARLALEYVDALPVLPSGKRKFTLSHVDASAVGRAGDASPHG